MQKKILWQKFEDLIEEQFKSPIVKMITDHHNNEVQKLLEQEMSPNDDFLSNEFEEMERERITTKPMLAMPNDISNEIYLSSSYDCWVGHANFDITEKMMMQINKVHGVEALKIITRYRFFVGAGRAFEFSDVRKGIEETLGKGENFESGNSGSVGQ